MKRIISILLVLAMVISLSACSQDKQGDGSQDSGAEQGTGSATGDESSGSDKGDSQKDKTGDSTIVYGSSDYTSINPALYEHGEINSLLFAGLTQHDANNNVIPALAESWTWNAEALTYTFILKDNITFHDGTPLTTEDVKFTLETIMNPENGSEIASNYEEIESITVIDAKTIDIKLSVPNVALPDYLVIGILPKHILEGEDIATSSFNQNPIGAGPYKLVEWDMGQAIVMEKFDGFYIGSPKIDNIIFKIIEDDDARELQLKSGEINLAQITPKDAEIFKPDPNFEVYTMGTADYRGILYNFNNEFWKNNPGLPAALSFGVDRESVISSVLLGQGQSAWSPIQKGIYANEAIEKFDYNPDRAREEIEKLGWAMGAGGYYEKDGQQLAFEISVRSSDQVRVDIANIAAQNFQDIGVNCVVDINEKTDWEGQSAFLIGWGSPFDPDDHTYKVFGTDKGANYSAYSNQAIDEILTEARSTEDAERRKELYAAFQEEYAKDPAYTLIAYIDALYVASSKINGISKQTTLGHHGVGIFWNVYDWKLS